MSFNQFMLPTLPQTPAASFKGTGSMDSTAINSPRNAEPTQEGRSFLATLNQVSDRRNCSCPESKPTENTGLNSERSNTDSMITATSSDLPENSAAGQETITAVPSEDAFASISPREAFGMIRSVLFGSSMNADMSSSANGSDAAQFEGQGLLMAWLGVIHPGEQMKADISPDANNLNFFQNLAAQAIFNQDNGANSSMHTQFSGLRHWMAAMSARIDLLNMQGVDSTVSGLNAESGGIEGPKTALYSDAIDVIKAFLLKMASHHQAQDNNLSENGKMAVAGKGSRLSHWANGDPNLEAILDPRPQGQRKNVQPHKFQAAVKTADNPANPQIAAEAMMTKPSEDISGMKTANLKTQMTLSDAFGNKVIQVEGENKDSSLLNAQDQMPERMLKFDRTARTSESAQRSLSSQTMNQIVQKAVLSVHNGQNQVQIHLKPEFLGHIRMQIVTENQQVAIKILAEIPFVKDMLESNLNQLRADLQSQGLKIDELEVSVAHDSNSNDKNQAAADASKRRALNGNPDSDDGLSEEPDQSQAGGAEGIAETAIDYFA